MNAYNVAMYRYRADLGADPGSKEEWEAHIQYTPLSERWTVVSPDDRHVLRGLLMADSAAASRLAVLLTEDGIFDTAPGDIIAMVREALAAHAATLAAIEPISREPD